MHGNVCNKYRKFKKTKMTYIFLKKIKCRHQYGKMF